MVWNADQSLVSEDSVDDIAHPSASIPDETVLSRSEADLHYGHPTSEDASQMGPDITTEAHATQTGTFGHPFDMSRLRDEGSLATWSVSTNKAGYGIEALRDGNPNTCWQYVISEFQ